MVFVLAFVLHPATTKQTAVVSGKILQVISFYPKLIRLIVRPFMEIQMPHLASSRTLGVQADFYSENGQVYLMSERL